MYCKIIIIDFLNGTICHISELLVFKKDLKRNSRTDTERRTRLTILVAITSPLYELLRRMSRQYSSVLYEHTAHMCCNFVTHFYCVYTRSMFLCESHNLRLDIWLERIRKRNLEHFNTILFINSNDFPQNAIKIAFVGFGFSRKRKIYTQSATLCHVSACKYF